ncbi:DUF4835 family protein [Rhodocytophaga aerolata]|uniref:DUF4835 family protein n=1 Tax=Rhodocytophaga aerolata TaxID=455078 RepID=A0ABT8R1T6_9BACT|nr:DUF4835 family protein [Rhodocytophaga aerolata]MDO1445344.1 DUF4835 family protein [Rhodocytophaga aerolata]
MLKKYIHPFILICLVTFACSTFSQAQELRCNVIIDTDQLRSSMVTEKQVFVDMQTAISNLMNNQRWTNDKYLPQERINCNLVIRITDMPSIKSFVGTAQIQSSRPVYGTDYESFLLNFIDREWQFEYTPAQPMDFNENTFTNNLTSMLSFYAYIIIGLDNDSFSRLGGSAYLQKAMIIANTAQQGATNGEKGWGSTEDNRNRYWLIENLLSPQMLPLREGLYTYHRQALDNFLASPEQARTQILEVLGNIKKINQIRPAALLTNTFFDTKINELINFFLEGTPQQKQTAYNLLVELDPTKTDKYNALIKN